MAIAPSGTVTLLFTDIVASTELRVGLGAGELDHIRDWPDDQKDRARAAVVDAWNRKTIVRFLWKLWDNPNDGVQVRTGTDGTVVITFFSPWDKVRVLGEDNITVDV